MVPREAASSVQMEEINCQPRSEVRWRGKLKRTTQLSRKAHEHSSAEIPARGAPSGQRVILFTIVITYEEPQEGGSGPIRSTCTCENALSGTLMEVTGVRTCCCTFAVLQRMQSFVHSATTILMQGHMKRLPTRHGSCGHWMLQAMQLIEGGAPKSH